jgi:hypothetical protein
VRQAETQRQAADGTVTARLPETYQWLLVPDQASPQAPITWQAIRLAGTDALAVRASRRLRSDEALVSSLGATILRKHLDEVPLWRGDRVAVAQLAEDFAQYPYLPRLKDSSVLLRAASDGVALLTWPTDGFAFADAYDESAQRYRGLRGGQQISITDAHSPGLLVKPEVARAQLEAEVEPPAGPSPYPVAPGPDGEHPPVPPPLPGEPQPAAAPKRFHGTVDLDPTRVGRDASRIADEVLAHLTGLVGAHVTVTLEIEAEIPSGAPDHVVRTVTENARTLKFTSQGFEKE